MHGKAIAFALVTLASAAPNLARSVLLTDAVNRLGARCLDGSAQRYFIQEPPPGSVNASRFVFDIMGGGWCESYEACAERAYGWRCFIGSSRPECFEREAPGNAPAGLAFNETMDFDDIPSCLGNRWCGGLLNNDPVNNPLTHDWTKVLFMYCDGGSFAGENRTATTVPNGTKELPLYFRGGANRRAIIEDLITHHGLAQATDLIITGNSAGGLASYWAADAITKRLPATRVVAAPDSGFFYTDESFPAWRDGLGFVFNAMNATGGLNQACVAAVGDPATCAYPEVAAQHITTPLFVMNSRFDPALDSISFGENGSNVTHVNQIGARLLALVKSTVLSRAGNAAFLTSCHEHCGQWAQDQTGTFADFNVTIDGLTAIPALTEWWLGGSQNLWVQEAPYPCATCCQGGQA
jgi:hypothetical protein